MGVAVLMPNVARADTDGGLGRCPADAGSECDAGTLDAGSSREADQVPVACDGALCATDNGAQCSIKHRLSRRHGLANTVALTSVLALLALSRRRSVHRRYLLLTSLAVIESAGITSNAVASPANTETDVTVRDAAAPRRLVAIEWNPLALVALHQWSANLLVVPIDHHAIIVSPHYVSTTTEPIYVYDDAGNPTRLPKQSFKGFGGELGYRYYFGSGGPRGVFVGPSMILTPIVATAENGEKTHFLNYGLAVDAGFEALVADRCALSLGAGIQYSKASKDIPPQQFPADVVANNGFRPRLLLSIGWAL